jgi:uncharacterized protein YbjQ (UPF0145 family)
MDLFPFFQIAIPIVIVVLAFFTGSMAERRHYASIRERESKSLSLPLLVTRQVPRAENVASSRLVTGSVVISVDAFKRMLAGLRGLVGGRVGAYESLIDRARREALLRMKADAHGADLVVNVRLETSTVGRTTDDGSVGSVEALAYGTAILYRK